MGFAVFGAWIAFSLSCVGLWWLACSLADRRATRLADPWHKLGPISGGRRRRRGGFGRRRASRLPNRVGVYTTPGTLRTVGSWPSATPHGTVSAGSEILRQRLAGNKSSAPSSSTLATRIAGASGAPPDRAA